MEVLNSSALTRSRELLTRIRAAAAAVEADANSLVELENESVLEVAKYLGLIGFRPLADRLVREFHELSNRRDDHIVTRVLAGMPESDGQAWGEKFGMSPEEYRNEQTAADRQQLVLLYAGKFQALLTEIVGIVRGQDAPVVPAWNRETGELSFMGEVVRKIVNLNQAENIVAILDAFQQAGWPPRIEDPLPGGFKSKRDERLANAVRSLNQGLESLTFKRDRTTEGIVWSAPT